MYKYVEKEDLKINELKETGKYRTYIEINRICGKYPLAKFNFQNRIDEAVVWCSNDYLGMSQNPTVIKAAKDAIDESGVGAGGSRNIAGTHKWFNKLESSLAEWHKKDAAIVFPTGYSSNDATLQFLLRSFDDAIVLSDELNHASIINGVRHSGIDKKIFKHNDVEHLESILKEIPIDRAKIIVFESVYSMDGDIAPIADIVNLAKKYGALTFLDEVHAIGMYGDQGRGLSDVVDVQDQIDLIQGTMAKALGVIGGYVAGESTNGSRRWLAIGPIRCQPSELVKVAVPLMMAWMLVAEAGAPTLKKTMICIMTAAIPSGLIFIQPDLDCAIFVILYALFVLFFAGMSWVLISCALGAVGVTIPFAWFFVMETYQKKRVLQFLNPELDPLGSGYQIIQSKIAIGSGGFTGKGWTNATQGNLGFIPESHTDFVFSTFGEEWGYWGCALLLGVYTFITIRTIWLAGQSESPFARLVSASFALSFFLYSFINIGMVSGLLPVMGSPLPFFSYGGTAVLTQGAIFGMIMSLCLRKKSICAPINSKSAAII